MDPLVMKWIIGVSGVIILLLLGVVGYFGKRTIEKFENSVREMITCFKDFGTEVRAEFGKVHARQDELDRKQARLRGEHDVITRNKKVCASE